MIPSRRAVDFFFPGQSIRHLTPIGGGNVNDSWQVQLLAGKSYILQRLSPAVFPDPKLVMTNLEVVTTHLHRQLKKQADCAIQVPQLLHAPTGGTTSYVDSQGAHWRILSYIGNSRTLITLASPVQAREIGRLLGCFHQLLSTLNPENLHNPLPGFHVTPAYLQQYDHICKDHSRPGNEKEEYCRTLIEQSRHRVDILERNRELLTTCIIHGDPKAANFLFAQESDIAISLIDFDTVMPGLLLNDLGDCLRSCCNPTGEEIDDPDKTSFAPELFTAVLHGYYNQALGLMNTKDRQLLIDAVWLISFELGLRFFTDHLAGNRYFKVRHPEHNLHRALVQFHLAGSIRSQRDRLDLLWQQIMMTENS